MNNYILSLIYVILFLCCMFTAMDAYKYYFSLEQTGGIKKQNSRVSPIFDNLVVKN